MTQPQRADPDLIKALAKDAKDLLEDRAFSTAIRALHAQWYGELIRESQNNPDKVTELVAKLRALEAIPKMLEHFMASEVMAQKRGSNGRRT